MSVSTISDKKLMIRKVNEGLIIYDFITLSLILVTAQTDEKLRFAASHLGLRYLYMFPFRMHSACSTSACGA